MEKTTQNGRNGRGKPFVFLPAPQAASQRKEVAERLLESLLEQKIN